MVQLGFVKAALVGLSAWLVLQATHVILDWTVPAWSLISLVVLPTLAALNDDAMERFAFKKVSYAKALGPLWLLGSVAHIAGAMWPSDVIALTGMAGLTAAGLLVAIPMMKAAPKATLLSDNPLTKGDDACFKQIVFAHRFLPIGLLLMLAGAMLAFWPSVWTFRLTNAGTHVVLIGFGLLSTYGTTHLWVPRLSGVPAIAAGAIKGELHSTLLGLTGLTIGFLTGVKGIMAGLGFFVFVGFFTYMGVLGANMMRNKSKTQRVTPEFVYIPWVFTAIFWLICAVLMGLFLNAVPDVLAHRFDGLRSMHVAAGLLGGFVQMAAGILTRAAPHRPLHFGGLQRLAFFAFNVGLVVWIAGAFNDSSNQAGIGLALIAISVMAFGQSLVELMQPEPSATA